MLDYQKRWNMEKKLKEKRLKFMPTQQGVCYVFVVVTGA
jgi:hypothetical protein